MLENRETKKEEMEIDLSELFSLFKKNLQFIILVGVIGGMVALTTTVFLIDKKYSSSSKIYIIPKITEQGTVDFNSMQTNSKLVNNYMEIIQGETVLSKVAAELDGVEMAKVKSSVNVSNKSDTEIIQISAVTEDPELSKEIVRSTVDNFFIEMKDILNIENMTILNEAKVDNVPVSPSIPKNTLLGIFAGALIATLIIVLRYILDKRLRNRDVTESYLGIPVLVCVPNKVRK